MTKDLRTEIDLQSLRQSANLVAAPWDANLLYYDGSEEWTWLFWQEGRPFRTLFDYLDKHSVVELACGRGRHAEQIVDRCGKLTLIDVFETNLDACRARLKGHDNVVYQFGDGYDFEPLPDGGATAIFCYDAMVHFSRDLVASYLKDAARVLAPGGLALFHHSNYNSPETTVHYGHNPHGRNHMTQALFNSYAAEAKLEVIEQILMDWELPDLDCLSLLRKPF